uniref:Uncharacterized protein n=1 Tax=Cryptomonas curvata TaxID=233186 RepID=A0A7S0ME85_9CRYP|mmetsp:Transcript_36960/g.77207  ORF Transcript_36960/g.77207 Transcript_36960/m.77207 type:complete len:180 (+) Transcript_36960:75-614(+)|eukprot:CAMPEP_0172181890 /NCGR_PEP_ID=MMETSP1050-20130122/18082_1 /TAXON_ID=233186 /ORGANISM="Cryptomonas curvata, Strain CCAP979/52" /LENGTH=179 /DNA_ID=CAMNT_0012855249 /DNA_START=46 /DNA_END=585 /DNA_ORIENTATION=-
MRHGILKITTTKSVCCPLNRRPLLDLDVLHELQLARANSRKNSSISSLVIPFHQQQSGSCSLKSGNLRVRFEDAEDSTALALNSDSSIKKSECSPGTGHVIYETTNQVSSETVKEVDNAESLRGETSCSSSSATLRFFPDKEDTFVHSIISEWTELFASADLFLCSTSPWLNQGYLGRK